MLLRALGRHPYYTTRPPPIEAWIMCASWEQSIAIQARLWAMVPKDMVRPDCTFDERRGFGAHHPALILRNGSIIRIKTTQQEALSLSGATIDVVMFDEPPDSERVFAEVLKRVQARSGTCLLTLTPINRPVGYLRKMCEDGLIEDLHFRLEQRWLRYADDGTTYVGADGRARDEDWITDVRRMSLAHEEPIVCDGEWEERAVGRVFTAFALTGPTAHVSTTLPTGEVRLLIGLDHGHGAGKEFAVLVAVDEREWPPAVWVVDEYASAGESTAEQDAIGILRMLRDRQFQWSDVGRAWGDRPYDAKSGRKGNLDIEDALVQLLGLRTRKQLAPRIWTAKRGQGAGAGSKATGVRWLHQQMLRPGRFFVHPRCTRVIESISKWDYTDSSEWKHAIDALRYALTDQILGARKAPRRRQRPEYG